MLVTDKPAEKIEAWKDRLCMKVAGAFAAPHEMSQDMLDSQSHLREQSSQ